MRKISITIYYRTAWEEIPINELRFFSKFLPHFYTPLFNRFLATLNPHLPAFGFKLLASKLRKSGVFSGHWCHHMFQRALLPSYPTRLSLMGYSNVPIANNIHCHIHRCSGSSGTTLTEWLGG